MQNEKLSRTIQTLANIGVVAGIVFLALEIRQNNDQLASQTRYNNLQAQGSIAAMIVADGELADLLAGALNGSSVSPGESLRLRQILIMLLNSWEYEFAEFEDGRATRAELKIDSKRQDRQTLFSIAPDLWDSYRLGASPGFVEFMEQEIL